MSSHQHKYWMAHALMLARKGLFTTSPNPMVGACVVRNNKLIGEGYHQRFGGPHAEVLALKKAKGNLSKATLYVTLEPCSSWGKTPPCLDAILKSGIRKVFVATKDPNPLHQGKAIRSLRKQGVDVHLGILKKEAASLNDSFFKYIKTKLPYVTLKMAQSIDGKIATFSGDSRWITSVKSRQFVHQLRAQQDAILVGKNTLLKDNPSLQPKIGKYRIQKKGKPYRVALDPRFEVKMNAKIFQGPQLTLVAVSEKKIKQVSRRTIKNRSVNILPIKEKRGELDLHDLLYKLGQLKVAKILVEGGGELAWSLLSAKLVDKAYWMVAPKIIGGRDAKSSVEGVGTRYLSKSIQFKNVVSYSLGDDWVFEGTF